MKTCSFQIVPLKTEVAEAARSVAGSGAPDHRIIVADSPDGFPCRHCLRWARKGERMVLFPFFSIPPGHPYSESGPIFVHEDRCQRYAAVTEYPSDFRDGRVFRAYNSSFDIIDAQLGNGSEPETVVENLLQNPDTRFVDARSVSRGCYTFRMERI